MSVACHTAHSVLLVALSEQLLMDLLLAVSLWCQMCSLREDIGGWSLAGSHKRSWEVLA